MKKLLLTLAAVVGMLGAGSGNAWADTVNTTLYSWVGKSGNATQTNGTIKEWSSTVTDGVRTNTASTSTSNINAAKENNKYYVLACSGSWAKLKGTSDATTYFEVTLDQPLATGDIISVTGYRTTDKSNKYARPAFVFNYGKESQYVLSDAELDYSNINSKAPSDDTQVDTEPNTQTYKIPKEADGATSFILTREATGTNLFITAISITGDRDPDAKAVAKLPTVSSPAFNFETHKYTVTLSSTESGASIHYSLNDATDYTTYADPIEVSNGDKISFYASADNEDNSATDVYNVSGLANDDTKAYVAWVYETAYSKYVVTSDPLYTALSTEYNVIPVTGAQASKVTVACPTLGSADLIVISEAMQGGKAFANSLLDYVGTTPVLSMKTWNGGSGRWGTAYGSGKNPSPTTNTIKPSDGNYELFKGLTVENGEIALFSVSTASSGNLIQGVSGATMDVTLATVGDYVAAYANKSDKYVLLGISSDNITKANDNAKQLIKNAAALLLADGNAATAATATDLGTAGFTNMAYATFVSEKAAIIPEGVTAYIGALNDNNTYLNLTEVSGYIPANTPVLLEGTKGTPATLKSTIYTIAEVKGNDLQGSTSDIDVPTGKDVYTLSIADGKVAFRKYTGKTLNAGKAYLALTAGGAAPMIRFTDMDTDEPGNVTGINAVTIENNAQQVIYDLRGRRVLSLDRPGLYIVNGKKVAVQ